MPEHLSVVMPAVNIPTWLLRLLDHVLPWSGASLIVVARRPAEPGSAYVGDERPETVGTERPPFSAVAEDGARPDRFAT